MNLIEYPDRDMMMMDVADTLASELTAALLTHEHVTFSVPGGTTPGPVFDTLSAVHLDWHRVSIVLNDERWVAETSERSNTRLLRERLLVNQAAEANLLPLYAEGGAPEDVLESLGSRITPRLPINILLLGMGTDGHIASLFPGADRLEEGLQPDAPILLPMRADAAPEPRITLTAPVLTGALQIHVLITGARKREVIEAAQDKAPADAPVRLVLDRATIHWSE